MADEYLHIKEIVKQSHTRAKEYNQEQLYLNSAMHGAMDGALAFEWERGSITTSTGADNNGSAYLNQYTRSSNFVPVTAGETICKKLNDTIVSTVVFVWYDANGSRVGSNNSTDLEIVVPAGAEKARVYFRRISSGTGDLEIGAGVVLYRKGSVLSQNIKEEMASYYSTRDPLFDPKAVRQAAWRGWNWDSPTYACPMNSWPAYEAAVNGGADMLWIAAVSVSKDGVFYAIHDEALQVANGVINMDVTPKKNSDGTWPSGAYPTYSYTAAQLDALVMGSASHTYADPESRRHPIRMSVLLAWAKANGIPVGIRTGRLPSTDGDTVWNSDYTTLTNKQIWESFADMIRKAGCEKDIFSADGNGVMTCLRKYLPECHLQYHGGMKTKSEGLAGVDKVKAFGGSVSINIYNAGWCREVLEYAQSQGVKTFVAVSDSAGHAFDYAQVPPDYIITTVDDGYGAKTPVMRKINDILEKVYFPETYGAAGDGVTDDTAAIQKAIDAAKNTKGVVYFSAASYKVSNILILRDGVTLRGNNGYEQWHAHTSLINTSTDMFGISGDTLRSVTLEGIAFYGSSTHSLFKAYDTVTYYYSLNMLKCQVFDYRWLTGSKSEKHIFYMASIIGCQFDIWSTGLMHFVDSTIRDCNVNYKAIAGVTQWDGVVVLVATSTLVDNLFITGTFDDDGSGQKALLHLAETGSTIGGLALKNCKIDYNEGHGINVYNNYGVLISGCSFRGLARTDASKACIMLNGNTSDCIITQNSFRPPHKKNGTAVSADSIGRSIYLNSGTSKNLVADNIYLIDRVVKDSGTGNIVR